jgi:hypothetical protein
MYLTNSFIMVAHGRQLMPSWLSLPMAGRAIVVINREGVEINNVLLYFIDSAKTL